MVPMWLRWTPDLHLTLIPGILSHGTWGSLQLWAMLGATGSSRGPDCALYYKGSSVVTSLVAQMVKNLPTMWGTQLWSLGWIDPLEKEMETHCSTLAWKIPWREKHSLWGRKELDMTEWLHLHFHFSVVTKTRPNKVVSDSLWPRGW